MAESGFMVGDKATLADYAIAPLILAIGMFPEGAGLVEGLDGIARFQAAVTSDGPFMSVAPPKPA